MQFSGVGHAIAVDINPNPQGIEHRVGNVDSRIAHPAARLHAVNNPPVCVSKDVALVVYQRIAKIYFWRSLWRALIDLVQDTQSPREVIDPKVVEQITACVDFAIRVAVKDQNTFSRSNPRGLLFVAVVVHIKPGPCVFALSGDAAVVI